METTDVYEHSLSAETIADNVDILTEILLRLPAKYLVRFKCISKQWLSLISDSRFCNDHTRKNINPPVSGLYLSRRSVSQPLINFKTKTRNGHQSLPKLDFLASSLHKKVVILHSCNGLLLCRRGTEIIVCNPTVQKFKVVPSSDKNRPRSSLFFLSFSPWVSPHFKVVWMNCTYKPQCLYDIEIYSSESGMWETIDAFRAEFRPLTRYVMCDGSLYWMAEKNNLMRFDIDAKTITTHQMPPEPVIFGVEVLYFGGYGQYLTLVQSSLRTPTKFRILEIDTHDFRWIIKYELDLGLVIKPPMWCCIGSAYVFYLKGGDEEDETPELLLARFTGKEITGQEITICNPNSKCQEKILQGLPRDIEKMMCGELISVYEFIESLALF